MAVTRFFQPSQVFRRLISRRRFSPFYPRLEDGVSRHAFHGVGVVRVCMGALFVVHTGVLTNVVRRGDHLSRSTEPLGASRPVVPISLIRRPSTGQQVRIFCRVFVYFGRYFRFFG